MAELTFIFNQAPTTIQCQEKDFFKVAVEKFANKVGVNQSDLYFLSNGKNIEPSQKVGEVFKNEIKTKNKIQILVYSAEDKKPSQNINTSKEIICPKCSEPCLIDIRDYKIYFSGCKKGHMEQDIPLSAFEMNQKLDESKIICELCKKQNKATTFENQFFRCLSCKKNICPLCKSSHGRDHDIIDFTQYNFICFNHNEKFSSFCKKCKINLCMECESEHKDKENLIYFRDILPNKDKYKENVNGLKTKINQYKEKINGIKRVLDTIIINLEIYYNINNNLMKDLEKKKKNYQLFTNINVCQKFNNVVINDITNLIKNDSFFDIINNSINFANKIGTKYNGKNIPYMSGIKSTEKIIEKKISDIKDSSYISQLYENIVRDQNSDIYEKVIYLGMLADECGFYDDMLFFMKALTKSKKYPLSSDERNLFSLACKKLISKYRDGIVKIQGYERRERKKKDSSFLPYIIEYKNIIENKINEKCQEIIKFIDNNILKNDLFMRYDDEGKTFLYKMMGDYYKYNCEVESFKSKYVNEANKFYNEALNCSKNFPIYVPEKLGLILNLTVFYYEILDEKKKAIELAKSTKEKFLQESTDLDEEDDDVKEAFRIIDLMRDNIKLWEK